MTRKHLSLNLGMKSFKYFTVLQINAWFLRIMSVTRKLLSLNLGLESF